MQKISKKENNTEKEISDEIKITDEEIKRNYYKSLGMVIIAPIIVAFMYFTFSILGILIGVPLGIIIGLNGLYGIYLYKFKPEKYRERLEKKKFISSSGYIRLNKIQVKIIIGIIILSMGSYWILLGISSLIELSWRSDSWGANYGYLILGIIFFLIGLVITRSGIIDYKKKSNY